MRITHRDHHPSLSFLSISILPFLISYSSNAIKQSEKRKIILSYMSFIINVIPREKMGRTTLIGVSMRR